MISRYVITIVIVALLATGTQATFAQSLQRIQLTQLEDMFTSMRSKTKWNVDGPLLWGYFFLDSSQERLKMAAMELGASGYRVVGIQSTDGNSLFRLHVERVETHTPASLHSRNSEFYAFAERQGLASYDGMDVGPVPAASK